MGISGNRPIYCRQIFDARQVELSDAVSATLAEQASSRHPRRSQGGHFTVVRLQDDADDVVTTFAVSCNGSVAPLQHRALQGDGIVRRDQPAFMGRGDGPVADEQSGNADGIRATPRG